MHILTIARLTGRITVLALVWASFDALLALFPYTIHTSLREAVLDTSFTRASLVTSLTCARAVRALENVFVSIGTA